MNPETSPKRRRPTWLALLVGVLALAFIFLASVMAEPYLISAAGVPVGVEPRASAGGWANSNVWLVAVSIGCTAVLAAGYAVKYLSPQGSLVPTLVLFFVVAAYVFFAQFPATRSALRIAIWCIGLPASFAIGAWLASKARNAA